MNRDAGDGARAGTPAEAVRHADLLLLAVHWTRVDDALAQAGDLAGKVVMTCSLPMSEDDSHLIIGHASSGAEALAEKVPDAKVVAAFNTIPGEVLFPVFEARDGAGPRPDLILCGDNAAAKKTASRLIRDIGFNPVDAGKLRVARYTEPFGLVVSQLAYGGKERSEPAYRFVGMGWCVTPCGSAVG